MFLAGLLYLERDKVWLTFLPGFQIIVLESDHGGVVWDMKNRKLLRHLPEFNGEISPDGKLGLYAPVRGGLFVSFF